MELAAIGPDVYACLTEGKRLGEANSGLVTRGGNLVVDTFWDLGHTRRLLDLYAEVAPGAPRRLVNTHHNGDHCWGNQLLADQGTEIIGHTLCADYMRRETGPELLQSLADLDDPPAALARLAEGLRAYDFEGITVTPPTTVIEGDTTLDLDGTAAELLYVGPAHTAGDVVVWLPEERILFTGDILFWQCTPIGWEGTGANWIAALERLAALEPATVVPGHGPLTDVEGLLGLRDYLVFVDREARAGYEAGRSSLDCAKGIELGPYGAWAEPERLAFMVYRTYRELEGVAWDEPIDVGRAFGETSELAAAYEAAALAP